MRIVSAPDHVRARNQGRATRGVAVGVCAAILALTIGGAAIAQQSADRPGARAAGGNGSPLLLGRTNGTSANPVTGQTELFARNDQYALRESNLSQAGGGAIHGCRTQVPPANAASPGDKPCLRANNLSTGQAFQFQTTQGNVGGRIQVGGTDVNQLNPQGVPFQTNASGLVANLNADKVDGLDAAQLQGQQGPPGPAGPPGPSTGPAGGDLSGNYPDPQIAAGAVDDGTLSTIVTRWEEATAPGVGFTTVVATCDPGERIIGGGANISEFVDDVHIISSRPASAAEGATLTGWRATVINESGGTGPIQFRAFAVCLT